MDRLVRVRDDLPRRRQMECFSDEVSSDGHGDDDETMRNDGGGGSGGGGGDPGASAVEQVKRRRGRPPGSKNKPKPLAVDPAAAMRPHVLEVPAGGDVARALEAFSRRRGLGVCVLAGTGAVADVPLRHPSPDADGGAAVVFRGRCEILSISGTFLPPSMSVAVPRAVRDLSVSLAGPRGQIVGGAVAGPLVAATTVVVLAATFADITFHRLPLEADASFSVSGSGEADEHCGCQPADPQPQDDTSGLHRQYPESMPPASASQPVPLYMRQAQETWPPPASTQRPRPPYK